MSSSLWPQSRIRVLFIASIEVVKEIMISCNGIGFKVKCHVPQMILGNNSPKFPFSK